MVEHDNWFVRMLQEMDVQDTGAAAPEARLFGQPGQAALNSLMIENLVALETCAERWGLLEILPHLQAAIAALKPSGSPPGTSQV